MVYKYEWRPPVGQVSACAMSGAIYDADRVPSEFARTLALLLPEEELAAFYAGIDTMRAQRVTRR